MSDILSIIVNGKPQAVVVGISVLALLIAWKALDVVARVVGRRDKDDK